MYCPKCGQEVSEYTRICPACGELLETTPAAVQQPQPQPQSQPQPQPQPYSNHYQQAPNMPIVPDYKVQSILLIVFSSILCCFGCVSLLALPFAIVALVNSNKIAVHMNVGNVDLAEETSRKTKMWCWISFGILMGSIVLVVIYYIYLFSSGMFDEIMQQFTDLQYQYNYDGSY